MEKNNMDHKIHVFHLLAVHFEKKKKKKQRSLLKRIALIR